MFSPKFRLSFITFDSAAKLHLPLTPTEERSVVVLHALYVAQRLCVLLPAADDGSLDSRPSLFMY